MWQLGKILSVLNKLPKLYLAKVLTFSYKYNIVYLLSLPSHPLAVPFRCTKELMHAAHSHAPFPCPHSQLFSVCCILKRLGSLGTTLDRCMCNYFKHTTSHVHYNITFLQLSLLIKRKRIESRLYLHLTPLPSICLTQKLPRQLTPPLGNERKHPTTPVHTFPSLSRGHCPEPSPQIAAARLSERLVEVLLLSPAS